MTASLDNHVALVSGGGSGIGAAIARGFSGAGAKVCISGRREELLRETAIAIADETGGELFTVAGDVSSPEDCRRMVNETVNRFGALQVLVNNAGLYAGGPLQESSAETIHSLVDVDLKGPIFLTQAALPELKKSADLRSSILNISSSVTFHPVVGLSVYSAAKAGLEMLTRCWAAELGPDRIRVNAICPGVVRTPIFETLMPAEEIEGFLAPFNDATPLGRIGEPDDVARLALFLTGPSSEWTTGAVIPLDGGLSLSSGG